MQYLNRSASVVFIIIGLLAISTGGCKKFEKAGNVAQPGIVLTFDDDRVDNWYKYLPLLDSVGAKATFYISRYHNLSPQKKAKLAVIRNHGHEIAYHSTNHLNMMDYVYKYKHPIEELIQKEVEPDLLRMRQDGFNPVTFAYPFGAHNPIIDRALKKYFKSVRALNGSFDFTKSLVSSTHNDVLYGLGIDKKSGRSSADIIKILHSVKNNSTIAVFVAHDINTGGLCISIETLKLVIGFVKANNFRFYTAAEISEQ